jgi:drug/metabolite transporter (DMT)-like permease
VTTATAAAVQRRISRGVGLAVAAATAYGVSPVLVKVSLDYGIDIFSLLLIRFVIASSVLWLLWFLAAGSLRSLAPAGASKGHERRVLLIQSALLGALIYASQVLAFTFALDRIGASLAIMIFYSYPAMIVLGARLLGREALTPRRVVAVVIVLTGIVMLASGGSGTTFDPLGILLALGSAVAVTVLTLALATLVERLHPVEFGASLTSGATFSYLIAALLAGASMHVPAEAWVVIVPLAILPSVIGMLLMSLGVREAGPSLAGLALTVEPVVAVVMAAAFLGEDLALLQLTGGAFVVLGVAVAIDGREAPPPSTAVGHPPPE